MAKAIKKSPLPTKKHQQIGVADDLLKFSFRLLDIKNEKFNIDHLHAPYLENFLERLQGVSQLRVEDFRSGKSKSLRAHMHDWERTTEPFGFSSINAQLRQCEAWQFQLSANEHGRIHGLLLHDVFYVVWLDPKHSLYA